MKRCTTLALVALLVAIVTTLFSGQSMAAERKPRKLNHKERKEAQEEEKREVAKKMIAPFSDKEALEALDNTDRAVVEGVRKIMDINKDSAKAVSELTKFFKDFDNKCFWVHYVPQGNPLFQTMRIYQVSHPEFKDKPIKVNKVLLSTNPEKKFVYEDGTPVPQQHFVMYVPSQLIPELENVKLVRIRVSKDGLHVIPISKKGYASPMQDMCYTHTLFPNGNQVIEGIEAPTLERWLMRFTNNVVSMVTPPVTQTPAAP